MSHCEPSTERRRPIRLEAEPRSVRGVSYWVGADANLGRHHPSPGATSFFLVDCTFRRLVAAEPPRLQDRALPPDGTARGEPVLGCAGIRKHFTGVDATRGNGVSSIGRDGRRQRSSYRSVAQRILGASRHSAGGTVARRGRRGFLCALFPLLPKPVCAPVVAAILALAALLLAGVGPAHASESVLVNANADGDTPLAGGTVRASACARHGVGAGAALRQTNGTLEEPTNAAGVTLLQFKRLPRCLIVDVAGGQANGARLPGSFRAEAPTITAARS